VLTNKITKVKRSTFNIITAGLIHRNKPPALPCN